jgi:MerT mercuric transport protein.
MVLADQQTDRSAAVRPARKSWLAVGGVLGAFLASACCVGPLVLLTLGISGAWIGNLTALEPYKPIFAVIALGFIAAGFRQVYDHKPTVCEPGSYCARPASARITKAAHWASLILVVAALTIDWWAPLLY